MAFDAYLQRADDYITKQIQKFEQQKRGNRSPPRANGYHQMSQSRQHGRMSSQGGYPGSPAPPHDQHHPPLGSMLPAGWIQNYDSQSQRWYYVDTTTGRSQWQPPSSEPHRAATFQPDTRMPSPYDQSNLRMRSNSQPQRPEMNEGGGQFLDPRQNGNAGPSPSVMSMQLPPGAHYDTKTGKVVHGMFPEGQTVQSWSQEIQRI